MHTKSASVHVCNYVVDKLWRCMGMRCECVLVCGRKAWGVNACVRVLCARGQQPVRAKKKKTRDMLEYPAGRPDQCISITNGIRH